MALLAYFQTENTNANGQQTSTFPAIGNNAGAWTFRQYAIVSSLTQNLTMTKPTGWTLIASGNGVMGSYLACYIDGNTLANNPTEWTFGGFDTHGCITYLWVGSSGTIVWDTVTLTTYAAASSITLPAVTVAAKPSAAIQVVFSVAQNWGNYIIPGAYVNDSIAASNDAVSTTSPRPLLFCPGGAYTAYPAVTVPTPSSAAGGYLTLGFHETSSGDFIKNVVTSLIGKQQPAVQRAVMGHTGTLVNRNVKDDITADNIVAKPLGRGSSSVLDVYGGGIQVYG